MVPSSDAGSTPAISTDASGTPEASLHGTSVGTGSNFFGIRMHVEVEFLKVSGAGNDFLLIDNIQTTWSLDWSAFAVAVCSRSFGVGADGILVLETGGPAKFRMLYFNADGSFGGMCGNGGRCVARYAVEHGLSDTPVHFEACGNIYQGDVNGDLVTLHLPDVTSLPHREIFRLPDETLLEGWVINTGSPHVVFRSDDVGGIDVVRIGRMVRTNQLVGPSGTNVNFYSAKHGVLSMRTYERGVEAETQACGTGAVATALVSSVLDDSVPPVSINVRSGEGLAVGFRRTRSGFTDLSLKGSAHFVFSGTVVYDTDEHRLVSHPLHTGEQRH